MTDTVAISCDHAGFALKEKVKSELSQMGYDCKDLGCFDESSVDYPDMGKIAANEVASAAATYGIVICGSGIGISIAANRNPQIRAALCHNRYTAEMARKHNDANILALGARVVDEATALECVRVFLNTKFEAGRHAERVAKLSNTA